MPGYSSYGAILFNLLTERFIRVLKKNKIKDEIVADGTTIFQTYENDLLGNITSTKDFRANLPNSNYTTASYVYDYANRLIETTTPSGTTSVEYDNLGRKRAEIDALNVSTTYSYNEAGLVTQILSPIDDYATAKTKRYYDANGNLTREDVYTDTTNFNTTRYFYDSMNALDGYCDQSER